MTSHQTDQVPSQFFVIDGDDSVLNLKKQILRALSTTSDLAQANAFVQTIVERFDAFSSDPLAFQAFTIATVISYTRCFNSKFSRQLDHSIFENNLPEGRAPSAEDMTERMFHNLIMNYRDKHIAHSDDFLKAGDVGGCVQFEAFGVAPVLASRVPQEDRTFYEGLQRLIVKAHSVASQRLDELNNRLLLQLQEGTALLTDQPSQVVPIPLEVSPLGMWGLAEAIGNIQT